MATPTRHLNLRLLYDALLEIRAEGHALNNERIFRLADLFHNVPLQLERSDAGETYDEDIMAWLNTRAQGNYLAQWLDLRTNEIMRTYPVQSTEDEGTE
jgi:hypothetical protein